MAELEEFGLSQTWHAASKLGTTTESCLPMGKPHFPHLSSGGDAVRVKGNDACKTPSPCA